MLQEHAHFSGKLPNNHRACHRLLSRPCKGTPASISLMPKRSLSILPLNSSLEIGSSEECEIIALNNSLDFAEPPVSSETIQLWIMYLSTPPHHAGEGVNPKTIKIPCSSPVPFVPKHLWGIHSSRYDKGSNTAQDAFRFGRNQWFPNIALHTLYGVIPSNWGWTIP